MRTLVFALFVATFPALALAQEQSAQSYRGPDLAAQRAAIERLAPLVGRWEGEANVLGPRPMQVHQTERVERELGGLVLLIHGAGYANPDHSGAPVFEAMAVISYDERADRYEFRSYTGGHANTGSAEFLPNGDLRWSPAIPGPVQMRYTISFAGTTWREVGEMSRDGGATWSETITLDLHRAAN
ncbi:MAG: hypothetical protein JNJ63_06210 [Hyphomonadaceae bacterium]|nr:hypothetical protein [Hyphomonadaceae bacterium]